jgi:hypothetical protein
MGVGNFIWYVTEYLCFLAILAYVGLNFIERFKINRKMFQMGLDILIKRNRSNVEQATHNSYSNEEDENPKTE